MKNKLIDILIFMGFMLLIFIILAIFINGLGFSANPDLFNP